ncbi:MAG: nucleotidyltransferase domain-containing protein [Nanoarchaeota archaeon]|nr:nucleotidyltransferase domain-containing protein [Nanoarchaeota archaeon]MBU4123924.1 nucleotidyltransferase domain-containing protein [Nanoarchaeota archaeon]
MLIDNEIKILECFFPFLENSYTTKEIEDKSGYSHERAYTILMELSKKDYLLKRKIGKTYLFCVNMKKDFLLPFMHFYTKKKEQFFKSKQISIKNLLNEFIEKISNSDLISVIVFGSFSKGEQTEESDVDVLCVTRKKHDIDKISLSLTHKYNRKITPVVVLAKDFMNIKKDNPVFYENLIKFGVVLYGMEALYKLMYGGKQ